MDKFLKIQSCERCGARLDLRIMSKMNEDIICLNCFQERNHPYYEAAAKEAEEAAGNYNYRGMFAGQNIHLMWCNSI